MKKSLIALAVLAASGAAMAQSSVTLYGVADVFVGSTKATTGVVGVTGPVSYTVTSARQTVLNSGGLSGSRWGLRGSEDLGAGLKGIFVLENGFNIDTGAAASATSLFNRQAFVGLNSASFGTLSLGHHYGAYFLAKGTFLSAQANSPTFDATNGAPVLTAANVQNAINANNTALPAATRMAAGNALVASQIGVVSRVGAWTGHNARLSNSISYTTPNISGFQAAVVYGLGENKTATASATQNVSASLSYINGPIGVAVTHQDDELAPGTHLKNTAIGGFYDLGIAKAFAAYNHAKYDGLAKQQEWAVGLRAPLGATTLVAQYAHSDGDSLGKAQSVGLSAEYSLSKRTTAYTAFNGTKLTSGASVKNNVFGVGVRHTF